ncbi:MAG: DUF6491 family protein [Caulobacteraceae bacterium]
MIRLPLALAAVSAAALSILGAASAQAAPHGADRSSCFRLSDLQGTRPDGVRRIYARTGVRTIYRIDLAFACPALRARNGIVISPTPGTDEICGPLDFDLKARDIAGPPTPCTVKSITRLTPDEAAALPKKVKP